MGLFLFRFWPVLMPLILYELWRFTARRRARRNGEKPPRFRDGPWYWAVLASLGIGLLCFLWLAGSLGEEKGRYLPPHMEQGRIVPGKVVP